MAAAQLTLRFPDAQALAREYERNLRHGGAFVPGAAGVAAGQDCVLVLARADGAEQRLAATVVEASGAGAAVALAPFDADVREALRAFAGPAAAAPERPVPGAEPGQAAPGGRRASRAPAALHERLRGLSAAEARRVAEEGEISERTLLERLYGRAVWEPLLRNPRLTQPEVARIARMGALPLPLLEAIVANAAWLQGSQVQRALLSNPRLGGELLLKVLRAVPVPELKLLPKQTAYPAAVREAARRLAAKL